MTKKQYDTPGRPIVGKAKKIGINITIDPDLNEKLAYLTKKLNMSKSALVEDMISSTIDNY